ncbi:MAG: hypothetical protein RML37_06415 [Chitinophagales bacterium]|nr:hypothetical protein [Chitinophagales bacterium]
MTRQIKIFKPKYTVPFASFIWFCHEENFYLNDGVNKIDFVHDYILRNTRTTPVVLYPGDVWDTNENWKNNSSAIERYTNDWNTIMASPSLATTKKVSIESLTSAARKFSKQLLDYNSVFVRLLKPTNIYLYDYQQAYRYSLKDGLIPTNQHPDYCDIVMTSDALHYCFKFLWGGGTIRVNGRYQLPPYGSFFNFKMYFQISGMNNFGERFNLSFIIKQIYKRMVKKIRK